MRAEVELKNSLLPSRRLFGAAMFAWATVHAVPAWCRDATSLREMQIHRVSELGLEIWVENQPAWEAGLQQGVSLKTFVAQSPADYYPPTVMMYLSVPGEVSDFTMADVARTAIRRAAENYKVPGPVRVTLKPEPAQYGMLSGYEARFDGWANGETVEVKVFVGNAPGRPVVAMQVYTLRGKLDHLGEHIRRAWTNLKYL